ncbi:MAG: glycosyltransferase [Candidatus Zixiibacteriota bacterium]|jgi:glycosyltransferase involved in cell wall biosynthesis
MRIGYIVFAFPQLSETFISGEIAVLERRGVAVTAFTLEPPRPRPSLVEGVEADVPSVDCSLPASNLRRLTVLFRMFSLAVRRPVAFVRTLLSAVFSRRKAVCLNFLQAGKAALHLRRHGVDLLHGGFADQPATVAMFAAALSGLPFSFAAHSGRDTRAEAVMLKQKVRYAAFVRTATRYIQEDLLGRFGGNGKVRAIHCGVDRREFEKTSAHRRRPFRILSVGNLVEPKGFGYLLRAARRLKERGLAFECVLVGDGPLRRDLEALRDELGVADVVTFAGALSHDDVKERLREAAVFVLPCVPVPGGYMDSSPVVIKEAMASGVPVVSTDISGIPEAVEAGAGILVPPGDAEALAGAIEEVYDDSWNGGGRFPAGPRIVEEKFDIEKNVAAMARAMREVASLC